MEQTASKSSDFFLAGGWMPICEGCYNCVLHGIFYIEQELGFNYFKDPFQLEHAMIV